MLSFITASEGDTVYVHADAAGLAVLEQAIIRLKQGLERGECVHEHLLTKAWGGGELVESILPQERETACRQVHHVKIYAWTPEWKEKHGL